MAAKHKTLVYSILKVLALIVIVLGAAHYVGYELSFRTAAALAVASGALYLFVVVTRKLFHYILMGLFAILVIFAIYAAHEIGVGREPEVFTNTYPVEEGITTINLAGTLERGSLLLHAANQDGIVMSTKTKQDAAPQLTFSPSGRVLEVEFESEGSFLQRIARQDIDLGLPASHRYVLDLKTAADVTMNLQDLRVDELTARIGSGNSTITFEQYPTDASLTLGGGDLFLRFPESAGVRILLLGTGNEASLPHFTKVESGIDVIFEQDSFLSVVPGSQLFVSQNFDDADEVIDIQILGGAATINASWYRG